MRGQRAAADGYGYTAITNTPGGISTIGEALADGTPFLWSVPVPGTEASPSISPFIRAKEVCWGGSTLPTSRRKTSPPTAR